MSGVLVDTSFYAALLNPRDALHRRSLELSQATWSPRVTSEFIRLELANLLSRSAGRNALAPLIDLRNDAGMIIVPCSTDRIQSGSLLYAARHDKYWSLTDCISFQVMTEYGLTEALTADHHYEQAGFKALMKQ